MALKAGKIQIMPDLACIGLVSKVGDAYLSQKGVYHVLPIEVKAKFGGWDGTFFYLFQPGWFGKTFDPDSLLADDPSGKLYGTYRRMVNDEQRVSVLAAIIGEKFAEFAAEFDGLTGEPTAKDVETLIRKYALGQDTGYVMVQRTNKDDDGNKQLTEQYNIQRFFPMTDAAIQEIQESAASEKRRKPLVVTWDE